MDSTSTPRDAAPDTGSTPLQDQATQLHEWYLSLQLGGFTQHEALHLIGVAVSARG